MFTSRFGCCEVLISDQGREFVNEVQEELFRLTGTEHCVTSAYHPQSNGLTERFNQTLQTALIKLVNESKMTGMITYQVYFLGTELLHKRLQR